MPKDKRWKGQDKLVVGTNLSEKKSLIIYYATVVGFAFAYHVISNQDWFISMAQPIFTGYAQISSWLLNIFGEETIANGAGITSAFFSLTIKEGCDAITPMILYSMAILAFPISLRLKWPGILVGLVSLFILNLIRIISLYFIGKHFSYDIFDIMHVDIWQILFLIITVFIWLLWLRWALIRRSLVEVSQ